MSGCFTIHSFLPGHPSANLKHLTTCDLSYRTEPGGSPTVIPKGTPVVEIGVAIDDDDTDGSKFMAADVGGKIYPIPYDNTICVAFY